MKDLLAWDQTLFKDSELFELDHVPEHFLHRDAQLQSLMYGVRPCPLWRAAPELPMYRLTGNGQDNSGSQGL